MATTCITYSGYAHDVVGQEVRIAGTFRVLDEAQTDDGRTYLVVESGDGSTFQISQRQMKESQR